MATPSPPFAQLRARISDALSDGLAAWRYGRAEVFEAPPVTQTQLETPPVTQTQLEIGEIPVAIQTHVSCGQRWWYGTFPDRSHCCSQWGHNTRNEAVLCSRLRVAEGFVMERSDVP